MMFNKRREILFLYSVKDANPNGDPLNANHPRYDEETGQIMTSDVRVKRTTRDEWILEGEEVLVNGEAVTLPAR
ncbi:MAG TPA: type I CRISPR-associated protein Cas7, partial [Thermotogota bacterium]|nr:type I CRISPR-associated protein Cas7 [Thermotogota bacterium]